MTAPPIKRLRRNAESTAETGNARDLDLLGVLYWAGLLSMPQLERLFFPSRRRAQQRMRALLDRGLVRAHLQGEALHRPNVYTLAPTGRSLLIDAGRLGPEAAPPRALPRVSKLAHALAVREVFAAFLGADRNGHLRLDDFRFEDELVAEPAFRGAKVIPDALALVTREEGMRTVGIEVDLGTEPHAVLRAKLETWRRLVEHGRSEAVPTTTALLLTASSEGRRASLLRLASEVGLAARTLALLPNHLGTALAEGWPWTLFAPPLLAERRGMRSEDVEFTPLLVDENEAFRPLGEGGGETK
ncbi:MAG: Replication-relaxation [Myxococcaceae bacterium]|nr:Replication-relaxation [Myxococcaceae bacterium]